MPEGQRITTLDEFEAEYRKDIGQPLLRRWSKEASLGNIRRFGDGVGDFNPLWSGARMSRCRSCPSSVRSSAIGPWTASVRAGAGWRMSRNTTAAAWTTLTMPKPMRSPPWRSPVPSAAASPTSACARQASYMRFRAVLPGVVGLQTRRAHPDTPPPVGSAATGPRAARYPL